MFYMQWNKDWIKMPNLLMEGNRRLKKTLDTVGAIKLIVSAVIQTRKVIYGDGWVVSGMYTDDRYQLVLTSLAVFAFAPSLLHRRRWHLEWSRQRNSRQSALCSTDEDSVYTRCTLLGGAAGYGDHRFI
jgi:hypothetical protein